MKQLPVFNLQDKEKGELLERISLANRPRLNSNPAKLREVTAKLTTRSTDRARFIKDPTGYLNEQRIPVVSCQLVAANVPTTEAGSVEVLAVNIGCVINVYVGLFVVAVAVAVWEVEVAATIPASDGVSAADPTRSQQSFDYGTSVI
ncbi:MAG: hypothetical protein ICV68_04285 [Pyrinomonadaceae bacterium]|nr:hypothetical protein [Pyrinomonadaceae bacterium]